MQPYLTRLALTVSVLAVWACTGGLSSQVRSQVTYQGSFDQLQQNPQSKQGQIVLLGGKIIETKVLKNGSDIEVLQLQLGGMDRPQDNDQSRGRFIVRSGQFLDPALYPQGMLITVVGRVQGAEMRPIGQMQYRYPLIELMEIKTWAAETLPSSPRFHFGIGVGKTF